MNTCIVNSSPVQLKGKQSSLLCWNFINESFDVFPLLLLRLCYLFLLFIFLLLLFSIIYNTSFVLKF